MRMADEQQQDRLQLLYQLSAQMASFGPVLATKMSVLSTVSLPWGLGAAGAETVKQGVDSGNPEGALLLQMLLALECPLYADAALTRCKPCMQSLCSTCSARCVSQPAFGAKIPTFHPQQAAASPHLCGQRSASC